MRNYFELGQFEPFHVVIDGFSHPFSLLTVVAKKVRMATLIHEYVIELGTDQYYYLTVVGDEDQAMANGIGKGWYVVERLTKEDGLRDIALLSEFTKMYTH